MDQGKDLNHSENDGKEQISATMLNQPDRCIPRRFFSRLTANFKEDFKWEYRQFDR